MTERQAATIAEFPASLTHRQEDITNLDIPSELVSTRLLISMEALQTDFFVDRLLLKRGYDAQAHLLLTSFRLVSDTLIFWTNFERFADMKTNFEWIVCANLPLSFPCTSCFLALLARGNRTAEG
jgi:hypothetical protein